MSVQWMSKYILIITVEELQILHVHGTRGHCAVRIPQGATPTVPLTLVAESNCHYIFYCPWSMKCISVCCVGFNRPELGCPVTTCFNELMKVYFDQDLSI